MSAEIELKLAVIDGRPRDVASALTRKLKRVGLQDEYFDTADGDLRRRGLVLRVRRENDQWMQTLKVARKSGTLVSERGEWEVSLEPGEQRPAPDLARFDREAREVLARMDLDAARLGPVFRSRVTRRRGVLLYGASRIEAALDEGKLRARRDGKSVQQRIAEVELELQGGHAADVLSLARQLVDDCSGTATLVPALRSKAERGYALAIDGAPTVTRASARGFTATLHDAIPAAEALRIVVRHGLAIVVANADGLRDDAKGELVHQARVALRRMRSALRLFDRNNEDLPAPLAKDLHWLAHTLGRARDWDVVFDATLPTIAPDHQGDALKRLHARAAHERKRALARAVRAVSSRRYAKLILAIAQWTLTPPEESASLADLAGSLLDDLARGMFENARGFAQLSPHRRHRVRIRAKRLRYALDLLAVTLPERAASDYIGALSELQDTLGELNDASVALALLSRLTDSRSVRRTLKDWHRTVETAQLKTAVARIGTLARRSRPWSA